MKLISFILIVIFVLSACGPSKEELSDAARREIERAAQQWFDQAKKDLEEAAKQQAEKQKDEIIRKYVGQGAPPNAVNLFVQAFKKAWPDIGAPLGNVVHWESTDTYTQEFLGKEGKSLLVLAEDQKSIYTIKAPWLQAYQDAGGPDVLGAPTNQIHQWNDGCSSAECFGKVQNFGAGGRQTVLMQRDGTNEVFSIWGGAWLDAYLAMRSNGMVGYPLTNRKAYGQRTGWFSWLGLGEYKQLGDMQVFTTQKGPYALVLPKEKIDSGAFYCTVASPFDVTSGSFPCTSELKSPAPYPPIPTEASKEDDQQLINYIRGYYMDGTLNDLLITYGRPKGPKSLRFVQEVIRRDYIYLRTHEFERVQQLASVIEAIWNVAFEPLIPDLLETLLKDGKITWQGYADFVQKHPAFRETIARFIEFTTGLTPEGDLSQQDILINAALAIIPVGILGKVAKPLLRPIESVLVRVGDEWVIKQGGKAIAKIAKLGLSSAIRAFPKKFWHKSTFATVEDSMTYHFEKHVIKASLNKTMEEYTQDAVEFYWQNQGRAVSRQLVDKTPGLYIESINKSSPGGYFKKDGNLIKIVTFWYNNLN